jgi:predicted type IV restriction endonuclease
MASLPKRVSERFSKQTRRFQKVLKRAIDRDINESDTVLIVADMLAGVFGYDKFTEITSEFAIRGTYCDLAVKVDGNVKFLIEVKAIGLDLKESHIRQAIGYGAQHGIQWVVLTNGVHWQIYRLVFDRPVRDELLCAFNFLDLSMRKSEHQEMLYLLCKEGLSKDVIEEYHEHLMSVNKFIISAILQSDSGLSMLRRELRRVSPGTKVDFEEISAILTADVLKRDVVDGEAMKDAHARVRKAAGKRLRGRRARAAPGG